MVFYYFLTLNGMIVVYCRNVISILAAATKRKEEIREEKKLLYAFEFDLISARDKIIR